MLNYEIGNQKEVDKFFEYARENNLQCYAIKGEPPKGAKYEDGDLVTRNINIGWEMSYTGYQVYFHYVEKGNK